MVAAAVAELCPEPEDTVSLTRLVQLLGRDKSRISRHVRRAVELGYLVNLEPVRGRPTKLRPGDPLPPPVTALPSPEKLLPPLERNTATLAGDRDHDAEDTVAPGGATPPQHPQHSGATVAGVAPPLPPGEQHSFCDADGENEEVLRCCARKSAPHFDATLVERVLARLHWLGSVYAFRLCEALAAPFEMLQPLLEHLVEQGHLVVQPPGPLTPESLVMSWDEARRLGWSTGESAGDA